MTPAEVAALKPGMVVVAKVKGRGWVLAMYASSAPYLDGIMVAVDVPGDYRPRKTWAQNVRHPTTTEELLTWPDGG